MRHYDLSRAELQLLLDRIASGRWIARLTHYGYGWAFGRDRLKPHHAGPGGRVSVGARNG